MQASQAAPGPLAAQQATNQLLGVLADQQGALQQMQATVGRAQTGYIMREVVADEQAQYNSKVWMTDYGAGTMRGPGQGQGPKLPD
jgi:conjugal transfer/entry exclusion protein